MNFYPFHIGDFSSHTRHLSLMEDLAYRRMLDLYYTSESPLPADPNQVARLIAMRDHVEDVKAVLADFFILVDEVHTHPRCDREIAIYKAKAERAVSANKSRWSKDKPSKPMTSDAVSDQISDATSDMTSDLISESDQIATNTNTKTKTKTKTNSQTNTGETAAIAPTPKPASIGTLKPDIVDQQTWDDWLQLRKNKKAPVTKTVVQGAIIEAGKAGMSLNDFFAEWCTRGSQGLKAEWLVNTGKGQKPQGGTINGVGVSAVGMQNYATMQAFLAKKAAKTVDMEGQ